MREILFRGKRLDTGDWVEGFYCCLKGGKYHYILTGMLDITHGYPDLVKNAVDPSTVGQFTGLLDKNGKRVFEGDVCRVTRPCVLAYGKITFRNGCFWFVDDGPSGMLRLCDVQTNGFKIEVIETIHDKEKQNEGK